MNKKPFKRDRNTRSDNPFDLRARSCANLTRDVSRLALAGAVIVAVGAGGGLPVRAQSNQDFISGTVLNLSDGKPEAGVWVIAETEALPTPFRKIVVTNDSGKFVLPDLPSAGYHVWVRGYGLKDSAPVDAAPGADLRLQASSAASSQDAASVYPAQYWFSLYQPPSPEELPDTIV